MDKIRRVVLGTPCYDGKITVHYADGLLNTAKLCAQHNIEIIPIYLSYDCLIQRARNDLIQMCIEGKVDDLIFIDSDIAWKPEDVVQLLSHDVDFVAGIYPKKSQEEESYPVKIFPNKPLELLDNNLMVMQGIPTGFLRLSARAMKILWDNSEVYKEKHKIGRMVCNVGIVDGELLSEDMWLCYKWNSLGETVYLDPFINLDHYGTYKWKGNFIRYLNELVKFSAQSEKQEPAAPTTKSSLMSWAAYGDPIRT